MLLHKIFRYPAPGVREPHRRFPKTLDSEQSKFTQRTCAKLRIGSVEDASKIIITVRKGMLSTTLPEVNHTAMRSGHVWGERCLNTEITGAGVKRFPDESGWSAPRRQDGFLLSDGGWVPNSFHGSVPVRWQPFIKQSYSVWVETEKGKTKWHLIKYFSPVSADQLGTVNDIAGVRDLEVPSGVFTNANILPGLRRRARWNPNPLELENTDCDIPPRLAQTWSSSTTDATSTTVTSLFSAMERTSPQVLCGSGSQPLALIIVVGGMVLGILLVIWRQVRSKARQLSSSGSQTRRRSISQTVHCRSVGYSGRCTGPSESF
ncbi:hypothetical protein K438DRAFT_832811 [Mycena galopus ATCC 62051]|nr:hypothetical protein K438DRAFT_832811 [Mycena galopus ATCC 62051]